MDLTGTAFIPLTGGFRAVIDLEDLPRVSAFKWHLTEEQSKSGLRYVRNRQQGLLHNFIMRGRGYDHKDCNGLNNRKSNLRRASLSENGGNRRKTPGLTSIFKGVSWREDTQCWRAYVNFEGKRTYLGSFESEVDAAKAYDRAAKDFFGEYARLNFK